MLPQKGHSGWAVCLGVVPLTKQIKNRFSGDAANKQSASCPVLLTRMTHIFCFDWAGIQTADESIVIKLQQMAGPIVLAPILDPFLLRHKHNLNPKLSTNKVLPIA